MGVKIVSIADMRASPPPPVASIWGDGFIIRPSLVNIMAEQKVGKSLFAEQLLKAWVDPNQHEFLGFPVKTLGKVLYLNEEVPQGSVHSRHNIMWGDRPAVWHANFLTGEDRGLRFDTDPALFYTIIAENLPDVVCIDPLDRYHTWDTNSNQQMGMLLERLTLPCRRFGTVVVFVHHFNKEGINDMRSPFSRGRGAGRLTADPDSIFTLQKKGDGIIELDAQLRHGEWPGPVQLIRDHFMCYQLASHGIQDAE